MRKIISVSLVIFIIYGSTAWAASKPTEKCRIEDWRMIHFKSMMSGYVLKIEGTTNCIKGKIYLRLYEDGKFIGNASGEIQHHTFSATALHIKERPKSLQFKHSVSDKSAF